MYYFSSHFSTLTAQLDFLQDHLQACIVKMVPALMRTTPIGLIIIDSVAAIFRPDGSDAAARAENMRQCVAGLLQLAHEHQCAVVCSNEVTDKVDGMDDRTAASLGMAWAALVRTRLRLSRPDRSKPVREMEVIWSPEVAPGSCEFFITSRGLSDVPETGDGELME